MKEKENASTLTGRVLNVVDALKHLVSLLDNFSTQILATVVAGAEQADAEIESFVALGNLGALYRQIISEINMLGLDEVTRSTVNANVTDISEGRNVDLLGAHVARALYRGNVRSRKYAIAFSKLMLQLPPVKELPTPVRIDDVSVVGPAPAGVEVLPSEAVEAKPIKGKVGRPAKAKDTVPVESEAVVVEPVIAPVDPVPVAVTPLPPAVAESSVVSEVKAIKFASGRLKGRLVEIITLLAAGKKVPDADRDYVKEKAAILPELVPLKKQLITLATAV